MHLEPRAAKRLWFIFKAAHPGKYYHSEGSPDQSGPPFCLGHHILAPLHHILAPCCTAPHAELACLPSALTPEGSGTSHRKLQELAGEPTHNKDTGHLHLMFLNGFISPDGVCKVLCVHYSPSEKGGTRASPFPLVHNEGRMTHGGRARNPKGITPNARISTSHFRNKTEI